MNDKESVDPFETRRDEALGRIAHLHYCLEALPVDETIKDRAHSSLSNLADATQKATHVAELDVVDEALLGLEEGYRAV